MSKVILHIGTQKTGTSAIQAFLASNRKLLRRQGFAYPMPSHKYAHANKNRNGYFLLVSVWLAGKFKRVSQQTKDYAHLDMKRFKKTLTKNKTVILSEECFWENAGRYRGFWHTLKKILDELGVSDIEFIVYLRRQDKFSESRWAQLIKANAKVSLTWSDFCKHKTVRALNDYDAMLSRIAQVFGKDCITLRVYEQERLEGGDVVCDFAKTCEIVADSSFIFPQAHKNPSLYANILEIRRIANLAQKRHKPSDFLYKTSLAANTRTTHRQKVCMLSRVERQAFLAPYASGNRNIAQSYLGKTKVQAQTARSKGNCNKPQHSYELFEPPSKKTQPWRRDEETLLEDVLLFFSIALARQKERLVFLCEKEHIKIKQPAFGQVPKEVFLRLDSDAVLTDFRCLAGCVIGKATLPRFFTWLRLFAWPTYKTRWENAHADHSEYAKQPLSKLILLFSNLLLQQTVRISRLENSYGLKMPARKDAVQNLSAPEGKTGSEKLCGFSIEFIQATLTNNQAIKTLMQASKG